MKKASFAFIVAFLILFTAVNNVWTTVQKSESKSSSQKVGDPITANSGSYYFSIPLLDLGGPLPLALSVNNCLNQESSWGLRNSFQNNLDHYMERVADGPDDFACVFLRNGDSLHFDFNKDTNEWELDATSPVRYVLKETGNLILGYFYLMDPVRERIYIFKKIDADATIDRTNARLVYLFDRNNNRHDYSFIGDTGLNSFLINRIIDNLGRSLDFTYAGFRITSIADQTGRQIGIAYEENAPDLNNQTVLRSVTDAVGNTTTFHYTYIAGSNASPITAKEHPLGNIPYTQTYAVVTLDNEDHVRVTSQADAFGNTTNLTYDGAKNQVTENRPDGNTLIWESYGNLGPVKSMTDPLGNQADFGQTANQQTSSVTDRTGQITNFTYHDKTGKPLTTTNNKGGILQNTYTAQQQTFTNPANAEQIPFTFYNLTRVDYPDGTFETYTYDAKGNVLTRTDRAGKVWNYTYNDRGQVLTRTNPAGGVTTFTYNADGTPATQTDSDTGITTYGYDALKRLNRVTRPDGTFTQFTYDLNDRIITITDENNHTYTYTYDANGNRIKVRDPKGNETHYTYDLMDRVIQITDKLGKNTTVTYDIMDSFLDENTVNLASITDPNGLQTTFGYDPRGWQNRVTLGGQNWQQGYNDEGVTTSRTTPLGHVTAFQRDNLGNLTGITDPLGHITTFTRDTMSLVTDVTDQLNRNRHYTYNNRGLLAGITLPVVGATAFTRNDIGLITRISDLNGRNWNFVYTNMGRPRSGTDPLGNTWQHAYDVSGRPDQTTYEDGVIQTFTYDDAGNVIQMAYTGGLNLQYTYDELNRLLTTNGLNLTRDLEGRITNTENPGVHFGATYDDGGRLKTATYNNGAFTVTYTYDGTTGLLSRVTDDLTGTQIDFTYDNDQRLTNITRSNGVNTTFTWDNAARLTRIQAGGIIDLQYTFDAAGQVTQTDWTAPLDPADFLIQETNAFTYNAASRVSTAGYGYDDRGRLTTAPGYAYTWDAGSRLTNIDGVTMTYNGLGDLVTRNEEGATIHYYYNYALGLIPIVAEQDEGSGQFLRYYVWTPEGRLLYMIDAANANKTSFYHFDHIGSTLALTDAAGTVTDAYCYTPYGKLLSHQGASPQPFTFVGQRGVRQEENSDTLFHMRARYYDAMQARFLSRDPVWPNLSDPQQINPYQYALNNPLQFVDVKGDTIDYLERYWEEEARKYRKAARAFEEGARCYDKFGNRMKIDYLKWMAYKYRELAANPGGAGPIGHQVEAALKREKERQKAWQQLKREQEEASRTRAELEQAKRDRAAREGPDLEWAGWMRQLELGHAAAKGKQPPGDAVGDTWIYDTPAEYHLGQNQSTNKPGH